ESPRGYSDHAGFAPVDDAAVWQAFRYPLEPCPAPERRLRPGVQYHMPTASELDGPQRHPVWRALAVPVPLNRTDSVRGSTAIMFPGAPELQYRGRHGFRRGSVGT